jgi:hypothetical protein
MTPDGLEEQSENIGDASRESFNLRTERSDTAPGRGAPRDSPASVHSTISRHKAQARRFTEHAAKPADAVSPDDNQPIQRGSGNTPADVRPWNFQEPEPLRDSGHPIKDTDGLPPGQNAGLEHAAPRDAPASVHSTISRHKEQARRFTEHAAKPADAVSPVHDAAQDSERISEQTQSQEVLPDGSATARDAPLRHEHAPRAQSERPGRIRFGGSSPAPKDAPRRKPTLSPDAAKYTPPGATDKPDSTAAPDGSKEGAHKKTGKPDEPKSDGGETPAAEDAPVAEDSATAEDSQPSADEAPGTQDAPSSDKKPGTKHGTERSHSKKPGKLRFSDDEAPPSTRDAPPESQTPSKKPDKARHKAERSEQKLDKARKNLPKKRSVRVDKIVDEKSGKIKKKLHFEETVKSRHEQLKGPLVTRPVKAGANAAIVNAHRKIYQVEHENVGTQAAHKGEMLIEGGMRGVYRMHKTAPYRRVEKLERRTTKLNIKTSYQQALNDNPKLNYHLLK